MMELILCKISSRKDKIHCSIEIIIFEGDARNSSLSLQYFVHSITLQLSYIIHTFLIKIRSHIVFFVIFSTKNTVIFVGNCLKMNIVKILHFDRTPTFYMHGYGRNIFKRIFYFLSLYNSFK